MKAHVWAWLVTPLRMKVIGPRQTCGSTGHTAAISITVESCLSRLQGLPREIMSHVFWTWTGEHWHLARMGR